MIPRATLVCIKPAKADKRRRSRSVEYGRGLYQRRTESPRPTKSRPRVKCFGFNFARGSESPFVHCTQSYGFACQPLRGLVTSRNGELSICRISAQKQHKKRSKNEFRFFFLNIDIEVPWEHSTFFVKYLNHPNYHCHC